MMTNVECSQFERILEQQSLDPLPPSAVDHLGGCDRCRVLWDDLEAIRTAAKEWAADTPEPAPHIWTSLRAQLQAEGLIRDTARPSWLSAWFGGAPRFAMAGAYMSLLLVGAILLNVRTESQIPSTYTRPQATRWVQSAFADPELGQSLDNDLKHVMASLPAHDPALSASLQKNIGIVDNMISLCEKSVREQPGDPLAREYLYGAYQQKAVLLATALDRSTSEGR